MTIFWYQRGERSLNPWTAVAERPLGSAGAAAYAQAQSSVARKPIAVQNVAGIMKAPVKSLTPDTPVPQARTFLQLHRFRHIPIVDSQGVLRGIVSERDLLREAARSSESLLEWISDAGPTSKRLQDIMNQRVLTASPQTRIREAAQALFTERIGCMPVLDDSAAVVGIITRSDILRALIEQAPTEFWI